MENHLDLGLAGADLAKGIAEVHHAFLVAFHAVQQGVHQRQAAGAGHQFDTDKGAAALKGLGLGVEVVVVVGVALDIGVGGNQKAGGAGSRSWMVSPGCGLRQLMMLSISGRGVKYWPAPDLVSLAFFSSRPS